ncbi:transmembrane protein 192-like [Daphnia pulicaria]|uniref:transmembrane protein 192-like n=1 Tax=Daphnia pulicaria TaxID=35523 RepID=UPI001EEB5EAE|nr:transmembrane protein 192-like [Daphnia pulicaria]XP_046643376.1 transmembrane protein 192-like [Daphnia pulicaria]XP_046649099.1 transmembrane protein 192-like [Daphnia pulicaria]XP_046649100.1 transmembrane protein 192-like [Daphnia pulicaria]
MVLEDMRDLLLASDSPDQLFKPIRTLPIVIFLLASDVTVLITSFILPQYYIDYQRHPSLYATLLYLQITLWVLTVIADQLITRQHQKSQLSGFLEFNRKIMPCMRAFLITVTSCSILLLITAAVAWDYCPRDKETENCSQFVPLTPAHYVQIILSLQTCILLPVCLAYSVRIHQFNASHPLPDILEGQMVYSLSRSLPAFEDVGVRETTDDTLLEKQAEAIHFLKEHNARLSRKILSLTDQLGRYSDANV